MYFVYILKSAKDKRLYIGQTNNLENRLAEHSSGQVTSTKYRLPVDLVYFEAYQNKDLALFREKQLKEFKSAYRQLKKRIFITPEDGG